MKTVLAILNRSLPLPAKFDLTIHNLPFPALTIRGLDSGPRGLPAIAVCQYRACGAALVRHPEMRFEVAALAREAVDLLPFCRCSDYDQIEECSVVCEGFEPDGRRILRVDRKQLDDQRGLARDWDRLLAAQGFESAYYREWHLPSPLQAAYA